MFGSGGGFTLPVSQERRHRMMLPMSLFGQLCVCVCMRMCESVSVLA